MADGSQLRCASKLHGILATGTIEVKCDSRFCGAGQGWAVYHTFDLATGELLNTNKFKNPPTAVGGG